MGLFEKLKNTIEPSELKRKKSHLKNLFSIAMSDGRLENEEFEFMLSVGNKLYLDSSVVQHVIQFPDDITFYIPTHDREKLDQIYDCVCMALIDGEINDREISTCKLIAVKLGFRPVIIDKMVDQIIRSILKGISSDIALSMILKEI
ncbi:hypothetical protein [Dyadobacter chenhuakuii]|uniref:Tellurite resistance protein TerB n=1 Tax=Dyadobacter chenhuakuii TaxID=2909339 RepID=A0A9X1QH91_9BACT|nr:hypothetical protein [Dyadobacter chenhuakuii]MCF2501690.1 hypothetical protein [Dyadobacter chenhuakuii]